MSTVPSSGKGIKHVYLVYGGRYELLAAAATPEAAHRLGTDYRLPFRVLGPVPLGEFIDWETVEEEAYGKDYGPTRDYVDLNDGVPLPDMVFGEPLTKTQARALPSHAKGR